MKKKIHKFGPFKMGPGIVIGDPDPSVQFKDAVVFDEGKYGNWTAHVVTLSDSFTSKCEQLFVWHESWEGPTRGIIKMQKYWKSPARVSKVLGVFTKDLYGYGTAEQMEEIREDPAYGNQSAATCYPGTNYVCVSLDQCAAYPEVWYQTDDEGAVVAVLLRLLPAESIEPVEG